MKIIKENISLSEFFVLSGLIDLTVKPKVSNFFNIHPVEISITLWSSK